MANYFDIKASDKQIRHVRVNRDGDLGFAASGASMMSMRLTDSTILGYYEGIDGERAFFDVKSDSTKLLVGGSDHNCVLYDVQTGRTVSNKNFGYRITCVGIDFAGQLFFVVTKENKSSISVITFYSGLDNFKELYSMNIRTGDDQTISSGIWGPDSEHVYLGSTTGQVIVYNIKTKQITEFTAHSDRITDITCSKDGLFYITTSHDSYIKMWSFKTNRNIKTICTYRPVNTADMLPTYPVMTFAGGVLASVITTTDATEHFIDPRFVNIYNNNQLGSMPGHSGSIASLRNLPDGSGFFSGAYDGSIRCYKFNKDFYDTLQIDTMKN